LLQQNSQWPFLFAISAHFLCNAAVGLVYFSQAGVHLQSVVSKQQNKLSISCAAYADSLVKNAVTD